ncbi:MAG: N-acetyltransferase [Ignavibacteriales bacterium CG_4_9_14_3_um_filter_30_11]|nr:MAG: N-acetyltransferase [Ignavibacteriales bacterium CG_4_9_14_3_um_filter_30_11]
MNKIKIRTATKNDMPIILTLIREIAEYEKLSHEVVATKEKVRETLFGNIKYAEVIIAEYDNKPVGQALFFHNYSTFLAQPGIYLEDLFVRPKFRGKGIGKELLKSLVKIAKERNCGRIEWTVLDWNKPAIDFYKSLGSKPMDEWITYRLISDNFDKLLNKNE